MAKCGWCRREMLTAHGCWRSPVHYPDGTKLDPILWDGPAGERCHDCGVMGVKGEEAKYPRGPFQHHPGCDCERCPKPECGGQLISCGCLDTDEDKRHAEQMRRAMQAWEKKQRESYG